MNEEQPSATLASDVPVTAVDPAAPAAPEKPKGPRFEELGLAPHVLKAVLDMGFEHATPVQAATLPLARLGKDLMVQSRTGSGKTAAFGLPFVNDLVDPNVKAVQAIVLLPTRELALQVASELARIAAGSALTVVPVYGGAPMGRQIELLRAGSQIVCGTPGRILDHLRRGTLSLDKVRCAVLDECDEMLSMGFQEDIEHILEHTPESRQTLLFSATVPEGIQRLARRFLKKPEILKLSADNVGVQEIRHVYYAIPGISREQELLRILTSRTRRAPSSSVTPAKRPVAWPSSCEGKASKPRPSHRTYPRAIASASWPACARARCISWSRLTSPPVASTSSDSRTCSITRSPSHPSSTSTAPAAPAAPVVT